MATLTASSNLISGNSHAQHGPTASFESKSVAMGFKSLKHTNPHNGLRILNPVDELLNRTPIKTNSVQAKRKGLQGKNVKPKGVIICGMNLIFVGTEVGPWSKTGGLGDVLGGLPPALAGYGHRVMTIAPRYDQYKDAWDTSVVVELKVGDRTEKVRYFHCYKRGVDRVFVDHPLFLAKVWGKTGTKLYGPTTGDDYEDNQLRFSLFCQAALEAPRVLNLNSSKYFSGPYGEDVVFIANDWHTALIPCYLKSMYQSVGIYKNARVALCIHNIAYQGRFAFADYALLNLPDQFKSSFDFIDGHLKPVVGRKINWMKAGIIESWFVITVSPNYAKELLSGPDKGVELDNILRKIEDRFIGIVNGMDVQEWNPSSDKYIAVKYDASTVLEAKALLKEALQAEVGLPVDRNIPLIGFIGRLEEQKGSDILAEAIPQFIKENVQLVALGTGKKQMEKQLQELEIAYPDKARGVAKFNVPLAHMIIAGADFILVPSRFEPCGLIQLQAMRYGTVPIVASTGGLVDTVKEGFTGFQMGSFNVECEAVDAADVDAIAKTVTRALAVYGTPAFTEMIQNCMAQDLSWKGPAKKWEEVLLSLGVPGSEPGSEDGEEIAPQAKENVATP
ncbi:granule-bound starch synthase 1, chloroplastic/amyloplastic-like [Vigna unguiculata]|uniref:Granule-bound starch synthase 1, chloroplastic/amyloplastic n=1 Tax=Vigna unguiculata TaxID=3917 RepID=A0A4D6MLN7_VIGUN|nr:granule-bound starch synthase 1, chloroplastic/amyloplastic-like [Vigna unguiculata]XP_027908265.1 granule-bound starch synthase 1, chloroplastic/amyloplastic-like [Vigna unguiculata]QCE02490.1 granule-bound starch synthase [Vigna unguiculata]